MDFISKYWQGIIALLALLTSVISVIVSFMTFKLQRTHYTKSVKPIIHIGQWDYENRIFVTMKNCGSGLAIVKQMKVLNKKNESKTCIYDWLPSKLPGTMNYKEYWTPYTEFVVQPSETIKLIELDIDTASKLEKKTREDIRRILGQLTVEVIYRDIYDNEMPIKRAELPHFLRTDNEN
jgi:hypothetical protein